ncbi:MAG: HAMP domain-containing histidine kinase [Planctomycetota bacterium]|nr:MAG: HAMP domain-containing histidine kinase [Planctomycetota bacterium]
MHSRTHAPPGSHARPAIEQLAEAAGLAVLTQAEDGTLLWASPAALRLFDCASLDQLRLRWDPRSPSALLAPGAGPPESDPDALALVRLLARCLHVRIHDLRAPLNSIALNLELLRRSLESAAARPGASAPESSLAAIAAGVARLDEGLHQLQQQLDLAQPSAERFDAGDALSDAAVLAGPVLAHQGLVLRLTRAPEPLTLAGDACLFRLCVAECLLLLARGVPRSGSIQLQALAERDRIVVLAACAPSGPAAAVAEGDRADATRAARAAAACAEDLARRLSLHFHATLECGDSADGPYRISLPRISGPAAGAPECPSCSSSKTSPNP